MNFLTIEKSSIVLPDPAGNWSSNFSPREKRRTPRIWQMALQAVSDSISVNGPDTKPGAIVTATALGALDETKNFLDTVIKTGFGAPRHFIASVHNSMAGRIAIDYAITGPNITICDGPNSLASALVATTTIADKYFPVLFVAVDERIALLDELYPHLSPQCRKMFIRNWQEAAIAMVLGKEEKKDCAQIRGYAPFPVTNENIEEQCLEKARNWCSDDFSTQSLQDVSKSFIQPALEAQHIISRHHDSHVIIPTYSPSAQAGALIEICQ